MVIAKLLGPLSMLQTRQDDDIFDRLSYYYTSVLLVIFAILVSFKQYAGKPLECWVDASYTDGWEEYAEMYCWAKNTYFVPFSEDIPTDHKERERREVSYYQWFPFILLLQALCFYAPCIMWRTLSNKSGFAIHHIVKRACHEDNMKTETRQENIKILAEHLETIMQRSRQHRQQYKHKPRLHGCLKCFNLRYYETYVTVLYLTAKLLFCMNLFIQLYLLNKFLQVDSGLYGLQVIQDLLRGHSWKSSGNFPRVTVCDFNIRLLGNTQTHSVQCVLVINIFAEKIFIILWFWFVILGIASTIALISWLWFMVIPWERRGFLRRHLQNASLLENLNRDRSRRLLQRFLHTHIRTDGLFVLTMITHHAGALFCTDLVESLWTQFAEKHGGLDMIRSMKSKHKSGANTPLLQLPLGSRTNEFSETDDFIVMMPNNRQSNSMPPSPEYSNATTATDDTRNDKMNDYQ